MKVAVCVSGEARQYEKCHPTFESFFKDYDCDVFLSTWEQRGGSGKTDRILNETDYIGPDAWDKLRADFISNQMTFEHFGFEKQNSLEIWEKKEEFDERFVDVDHLKSLYKPKAIEVMRNDSLPLELNGTKIKRFHNKFPQDYQVYKADLMRRKYEKENNIKYDIVVKTRFDIVHINGIQLKDADLSDILVTSPGYQRLSAQGKWNPFNLWAKEFPLEFFEKILSREREHFSPNERKIQETICGLLEELQLEDYKDLIIDDLKLDAEKTLSSKKSLRTVQLQDCFAISNPEYVQLYSMPFITTLKWIACENKFTYPFDQFWQDYGIQNGQVPNLLKEEYGYEDTTNILNYYLWKSGVDFSCATEMEWTLGRLLP